MNTPNENQKKLIPEWSRSADDQVLLAGLVVAVVLFGLFGWRQFFSGEEIAAPISPSNPAEIIQLDDLGVELENLTLGANVQAAVAGLPGDITGSESESTALLEGFVANQSERTEAAKVALAVTGIDSVDNKLKLLEPSVAGALVRAEVSSPEVRGVGTVITISGTLNSEEQREEAISSAAAVAGVSQVIDDLVLARPAPALNEPAVEEVVATIAEQLNELPQVQFEHGSANIIPASSGDLDEAARLLSLVDNTYQGTIEVQGYTDTTGDAASNQKLSEARAAAVRDSLIESGVSAALLNSKGYGPTSEFGESFAANRLVRFEAIA